MAGGVPLLRVSLRPFVETRPGMPQPVLRIGAWARWTAEGQPPGHLGSYLGDPTVLAMEHHYSVIPRLARTRGRIRCVAPPGPATAPSWEGITCRWGNAQVWFRNDLFPAGHPDAWMPFSVLALLPDLDPPSRPAMLYLGTQFFTQHSQLEIRLRYGDIRYHPSTSGPPHPIAHSQCGEVLG